MRSVGSAYFTRVADSDTRAQIGLAGWHADFPSTSTFLDLFACRNFLPRSPDNENLSQFCDRRADDLMRRATEAQTSDPRAADALWARAEQRVLAAVAAIPLVNAQRTDLVSTRVRNDQYHANWSLLLDQVSVR